ncbi:uncharacterized protein LOC112562594 isoform X2 [Pomacea canaliculata]|uniref:uncharacterized protein LOC112562594 isoform X2 n=1 Tax=Pomacea canaliculata TaxID=400727 RepID=UPI000D730FAE|nr:uncharacterized protein LOC112562594 isoform X2 [Pomacea canaliculata]
MWTGRICYILALLSTAIPGAGSMEEGAGFVPFWNVCGVRRLFNRRLCCGDEDCNPGFCCQMEVSHASFSVEGHCEARDTNTRLCVRRRHCLSDAQCMPGECCRVDWYHNKRGVCSGYGKEGDSCFLGFYLHKVLPVTCPCSPGLLCMASPRDNKKGLCRAARTTTTNRSPSPFYTTLKATSTAAATSATTTSLTTPVVVGECTKDSQCLDTTFFCCFRAVQCRLRPAAGDDCGVDTCPCRDSVCSNPTGAGQCLELS